MFITASQIHDGNRFLPADTVLEVAEDGTVIALHGTEKLAEATHHEGILCPGFVNAHCHLELSHMQGALPEHTTLIPFLQGVTGQRNNFTEEQRKAARHEAYQTLVRGGVVAVGDIANTPETLDVRALDALHIHTFIECIGFTQSFAQQRLDFSRQVLHAFAEQETGSKLLRQSVVPHAPYSVSEGLFSLIDGDAPDSLISIHNQETAAENEFYRQKTGMVNQLLDGFGIDSSFFHPSGHDSLPTYGEWLSPSHPLLLVHNTFSGAADVAYVQNRFPQAYWCLCPNANLYIEDHLPDATLLASLTDAICIGTDSLSSNHQLSILSELQSLHKAFPTLGLETLLRWSTLNGAKALQMDTIVGSFEVGKQPGVLVLRDWERDAVVERIV